jgi:hypothetical protein
MALQNKQAKPNQLTKSRTSFKKEINNNKETKSLFINQNNHAE